MRKYKPKDENVTKLKIYEFKKYLAYITKNKKSDCININNYGKHS